MVIDRVLKIKDLKKLNKSQFYKKTGLSNGFLDKVRDVGCSKIELILNAFPDINPEWLLTGKGDMLRSDYSQETDLISVSEKKSSYGNNINYKDKYIIAMEEKEVLYKENTALRKKVEILEKQLPSESLEKIKSVG